MVFSITTLAFVTGEPSAYLTTPFTMPFAVSGTGKGNIVFFRATGSCHGLSCYEQHEYFFHCFVFYAVVVPQLIILFR